MTKLSQRVGTSLRAVLLYAAVLGAIAFALWQSDLLSDDERWSPTRRDASPYTEPVPWDLSTNELTAPAAVETIAYGQVRPARDLELRPQVEGRILSMHPQLVLGGKISEGERLWQIDPAEAEARLALATAERQRAQGRLLEEQGRVRAAAREWSLLNTTQFEVSDEDRSLALREPHLAQAEADVAGRLAEERLAVIEVERCTERAPFDAVVVSEAIEIGMRVELNQPIGRIVASDLVHVDVEVPSDIAHLLLRGSLRATVRPSIGDSTELDARFLRWLATGQAQTQMPRLLFEVSWREARQLWIDRRVQVRVLVESEDEAWDVLKSAVVHAVDGGASVYVIRDDRNATEVPIEILEKSPTGYVVSGALTVGDLVVRDGNAAVRSTKTEEVR